MMSMPIAKQRARKTHIVDLGNFGVKKYHARFTRAFIVVVTADHEI